jgi:hypothetical protein
MKKDKSDDICKVRTTYPIRKLPYVPNAVRDMPFTIHPVGARPKAEDKEYPRSTGPILCHCGGRLVTERTTQGQLADEHDVFRVHCSWCPMSSRWLNYESDCLEEIIHGADLRRILPK